MSFQNMLIQPFSVGQQDDIDATLIPDSAFAELRNVYLYRGRIKKKFGTAFLGRLTIPLTAQALGNTGASPFVANIFTVLALTGIIIPGSVTINIAAPVGPLVYTEPATPDGTINSGANTGTIDYTTGAISLNHPAGAASAVTIDFTYAKGLSVMGLSNRELIAVNREELVAFDEQDAYAYNAATSTFNLISPATGWTGTDSDFFWTWNYWRTGATNLLWVTNNVAADRIRYYAGGGAGGWTTVIPQLDTGGGTRFLWTCRIIISYRNRLVCLNTTERDTGAGTTINYQSRARWSANGDPTTVTNWIDDAVGSGGFIDAPTSERIITAQFIKDTLVVGFERSTWILKYTGNETLPFIWERVNTELGCESTFSSVSFDDVTIQTGFRGITAANSNGVERIDGKIPTQIQKIHNEQDGQKRVHGIRDFNEQMVYWTFPTGSLDTTAYPKVFPDSLIAYNYIENAFSTFDGHFTCLGYYQPANDLTWAAAGAQGYEWSNADFTWSSGQVQAGYPTIVGGNQVGIVSEIEQGKLNNSTSLYISGVTQANPAVITAPNHNLQDNQCIEITDVLGMTELNDNIYFVANATVNTFEIQTLNAAGGRDDVNSTGFGAYVGLGYITLIDNFKILTKQFNQFVGNDSQVRIGIIEFLLNTTNSGEINLDVYIDQNVDTPMASFSVDTADQPSPPVAARKFWQRVYSNMIANYIQFELNYTDQQIYNSSINTQNIELNAINIQVSPAGQKGAFA